MYYAVAVALTDPLRATEDNSFKVQLLALHVVHICTSNSLLRTSRNVRAVAGDITTKIRITSLRKKRTQ